MPLPDNGLEWPPKALTNITPHLGVWSAWYAGEPGELARVYGQGAGVGYANHPAQYRGGIVGAAARMWWGRPTDIAGSSGRDQLHVPIAADLCQASADLLYAEPPTLSVDLGKAKTNPTQDRLNEYADDGFQTVLASGAEIGAALGGRYHRVTWDGDLLSRPFLDTIHADAAWPTFRYDRLVAVTFWWVLSSENNRVVRHVERHELDATGNGLVFHGLYEGTPSNLGLAIPLTEHTATAGLVPFLGADGAIREGRTPGLCVEYIPNQRPQRRWRTDPVGKSLGRSDLDGVEGLMDALDEAYSSWMRDIRLGKARIIVPDSLLQAGAPGTGSSFNMDREVFVGLPGALPSRNDSGGLPIKAEQFAIRVDEHLRTCQELTENILRSAGYSAQTFGEGPDGAAVTATEVTSRERRSYLTRDRKIRLERPAVQRLVEKMLTIDADVFRTRGLDTAANVTITFGDSVQDSPLSLAQTMTALETAKAASTKTKVEMLHPDWDADKVRQEVSLIEAQYAITLSDPTEVDGGPVKVDPAEIKAMADAMGALIRSGVEPEDAARQVGFEDIGFTGAVPVTLRLPQTQAAQLEDTSGGGGL